MPTPTVQSVTPKTGKTGGGSLVTIIGTDFDVPTGSVPVTPTEVTVEFGAGQFATNVRVISRNKITCLPPAADIPVEPTTLVPVPPTALAVDVIVTNVDPGPDAGFGALVDGFTYRRPDTTVQSHLTTVHKTLLKRMMQQIILNVVNTTQTDYDNQVQDLENRPERAKLPSITIIGPNIPPHRTVNYNDTTLVRTPAGATPTDYERRRKVAAIHMEYDVRVLTNSKAELLNLLQELIAFQQRNEYLEVLRDPLNDLGGMVRYPLQWTVPFAIADRASRADVREAVASWRVEGVLLESGDILEAAKTVDTSVVITEQIP